MNLLPTFPGKQVAFIDTSVTNYASLVAAVPEGVEVVLLDAAGSGLEQMAAWAASHAGYDAIHVLSHGTDGALTLGRETIDAQRLDDPAVRLLFQELGRALNPDGDLLLYGCSVAGGAVGQVFIDKLAGLTGADIAASTGLTGSAALGGDWRLEAGTGAIETMTLSAIGFDQVLGGVPPAAPTGLDLAAASDSGFSNTDNWTNIPTVVITGMAQPGTTVKLYGNDGTTVYGTTTAAGDGSWSITTIPLPTNVHRLRATATDAAGNESAASAILEVTLDTEAGPISITSDKSVLMPGETATITFGFIENPGTTFTSSDIIVAGGTLGPLSGSYPAFTAVFTPTPDASGTAQIEVPGNAFQDPAGNGNAPWSLNLPYLAAPTVSITSDKPALKVGETATITFTFSRDPGASFDSTDILVTGGTLGALSGAGATRSAVFTPTADVNAGTASIAVPANSYTDGYGNQGKAASLSSLSFDTRAPAAPLALDLAAGSDSGFSNTDNWTNIPTVVITGTAEAGATVKLYGNDGTTVYGTTTAAGDGSWSITTIPLPTNVHRLRATATDAAGNESAASAILEVTLDTVAGPVSITSDKSVLKAGETATVTFGFIEDPGATFTRSDITVTGGTLGPLSGSGTTFTAVFTPTPDATGTAQIEVPTNAFQDPAGNGNSFTYVNLLAYDTKPPAAPQALDLATASDTGDSNTDKLTKLPTPLIEGTAEAGAAITLYDSDGITVIGRGSAAGNGHWAVTTDALGSGTHTITAKATDTAGNDSAASTGLAVTIDAVAPTLAITSDKASLKAGETATVTLTFSEDPGSSFDANDIAVTGGTLGTLSGSGNTRTAVFTPSANTNGGTAGITVAAGSYSDSAGNDGGAGATPALTFDTAAPSLAIASDKAALRAGETATITFTFSEDPGATFDATDIAVSGGTLGSLSGSGTTRTAVFTPDANTDAGSASITVAAGRYADAAGNVGDAGASPSLTFDTAVPAAPLALDLSAASDTGASDSDNITRNRAPLVSGTATAGTTVTLYGSDGSTALGSATAGGDGSWSITSSALADGTHTLTARARDAAGNASAASAPLQVTVDTTGPSLAISSDKAALKAGETAAITFTFSEDPGASFTSDDVVVSGGTLGALSGSGATRTAVFTPDAATNGGSASITVAAGLYNDAAGNSGAAASTPALVFDTSAPAAPLALDLAAASDTGSSNSDNITRTTAPVISGTAEAGATVTVYDSDGSTVLGSATAAGDGSWSVTTSALGAGTHLLTARAIDAAGNASAASASLAVTVDTTAPTLAITSDKAALKAGETATITFTFSEDPGATFTSADIAVTGGTLGALAGSGATRTAVFTPQANTNGGSAGITVGAGSYADTAGNSGGAGLAPPLSFDTAAPSLAITSDKAALKAGETATITFTFSEDPGATFDVADITVSGGSLGALSGSGTVRTALFTPQAGTNGGAASITVAPGLYADSAGNSGTAGASPALAFDTAAPTLSITSDKAALKAGDTAAITFTFSDDPGASFDAADVTVSGGTLGAISGTGAVRTAVFTPSANTNGGAAAISVAAGRYSDAAGNGGAAGTADALAFDTAAPTLVISSDKAALKAGETATITFTFSEDPGASFTSDDIVVSGGTLGALSGSGAMRTAVFTPDAATNGGSASITVAASLYNDAAGNSGAAASTPALVFDTSAPAAPLALDLAAASDTG
ncbi:Ig-like domain-containing protein, partial [Massilia solisilvae]